MKKRRTWQSKLTKAELKHLNEVRSRSGVRVTLGNLKEMFKYQAKMRIGEDGYEPCLLCRGIARKLGFEI